MRLTILNYTRRKIGGTEQNLDVVLPELERRGHVLQFVYFHDQPMDRAAVRTCPETELIDAGELGSEEALRRVSQFQPDLINVHGDVDHAFQTSLLSIAPAAYSVHNYYGTCISGLKTHQFPIIQPCNHVLGPACLVRYFPRRCGGLNPVTMLQRYRAERKRLEVMAHYDAVITHSRHMETEYMRHGLYPAQVYGLPYEVGAGTGEIKAPSVSVEERVALLFAGRMEKLKGGQVLLRALPELQAQLGRPVTLHLAGDGPDRSRWERLAKEIAVQHPAISIEFHGWVTGDSMSALYRQTHVLVVPSLWPEPFGKVGPEAGTYGIPVAAFAVGGVGEWLTDNVNGKAAPGNPPTPSGLASAIAACVADSATHRRLSSGAFEQVKRFDLKVHVDHLLSLFQQLIQRGTQSRALAAAG